jgi:hypothetical protein
VWLIDILYNTKYAFLYASGWKKFEALWNFMIRAGQLGCMTPLLEAVLSKVSQ